ncbi:MAG: hypothetical protein QXW91_02790 [Candidatus Nitrosotenuis sp.]
MSQTPLQSVLDLGASFVALINKHGRVLDSSSKINLDDRKKEMLFMSSALAQNMCEDFDAELGPVEYSLVERKEHKLVSIPMQYGILLMAIPKDIDHNEVICVVKNSYVFPNDNLQGTCAA